MGILRPPSPPRARGPGPVVSRIPAGEQAGRPRDGTPPVAGTPGLHGLKGTAHKRLRLHGSGRPPPGTGTTGSTVHSPGVSHPDGRPHPGGFPGREISCRFSEKRAEHGGGRVRTHLPPFSAPDGQNGPRHTREK
ncbi:hypothetical protein GCM10014719_69500 [Planomonospora parontospora subsp. antibiotica]|nr:hypothetical protein GCM10014719_69500 [Planomonospora parontospora subsp. antibiotica]GII20172.1 hypothetical protein Ppa05_68980 [Planomonospora parontospora subsp. antibiotica]